MCADDTWYISEEVYDVNKELTIWLSLENINLKISNLSYSSSTEDILNAKTSLGK